MVKNYILSKELAQEAWDMLPDSCKDIMKNIKKSYIESLAAEIEYALKKTE